MPLVLSGGDSVRLLPPDSFLRAESFGIPLPGSFTAPLRKLSLISRKP